MEIVKATFADLEYILPLIIRYYEEDRADTELTDEFIVQQTVAMLQSDNCAIYAAVKDEEIVGVAGLNVAFMLGETQAQEVFWKVKAGYTKTKAGAKLLAALEEEAKSMKAETFTVVALAGPHERRIGNSYVSKGFQPVCSTYTKRLG